MLKVFLKSHCIGSQKGELFLQQKGIKYQRINLSYQTLSEMDVYEMISVAEADF